MRRPLSPAREAVAACQTRGLGLGRGSVAVGVLGMGGFFHDVLEGRVRDVKKWVEGGQKVGLYDEYGNTALHMAAEKGFRGVCKVLLDAGAEVNQRNESVGWTAVHYAAYEGHADVLRMLIAHGALPDIADKAGDTAESYAREWDNEECQRIIQEAAGRARSMARPSESKADSLCDSRDSRSPSDDSDEDEDESSMMNWVIPPVAAPPRTANLSLEPSSNLAGSRQLGGAMEDLRAGGKEAPEHWSPGPEHWSPGPEHHLSVHLAPPGRRHQEEEDTESEDTLRLMQEAGRVKAKARPCSIVDRVISSSRSPGPGDSCGRSPVPGDSCGPAPPDIDCLLQDLSLRTSGPHREGRQGAGLAGDDVAVIRTIEEAELRIAAEKVRREKPSSQDGGPGPRLRLEQLLALSSATIPDSLTMSCSSLGPGEEEGEKEALVRRLRELIEGEGRQVAESLAARRRELGAAEAGRAAGLERLRAAHRREEEEAVARQAEEVREQATRHAAEEERVGREVAALEGELERLAAPARLLTSLSAPGPSVQAPATLRAELSELEQELQCCACRTVCAPPTLIYQCPEGDLLCGDCRGGALTSCPACRLELAGQTSRNKVLENIARRYFRQN